MFARLTADRPILLSVLSALAAMALAAIAARQSALSLAGLDFVVSLLVVLVGSFVLSLTAPQNLPYKISWIAFFLFVLGGIRLLPMEIADVLNAHAVPVDMLQIGICLAISIAIASDLIRPLPTYFHTSAAALCLGVAGAVSAAALAGASPGVVVAGSGIAAALVPTFLVRFSVSFSEGGDNHTNAVASLDQRIGVAAFGVFFAAIAFGFHLIALSGIANTLPSLQVQGLVGVSAILPLLVMTSVGVGALALMGHNEHIAEASNLRIAAYRGVFKGLLRPVNASLSLGLCGVASILVIVLLFEVKSLSATLVILVTASAIGVGICFASLRTSILFAAFALIVTIVAAGLATILLGVRTPLTSLFAVEANLATILALTTWAPLFLEWREARHRRRHNRDVTVEAIVQGAPALLLAVVSVSVVLIAASTSGYLPAAITELIRYGLMMMVGAVLAVPIMIGYGALIGRH
ncbi:MAG: hypothetical protein AAFR21_10465 [Pseudomonadota bacterium]